MMVIKHVVGSIKCKHKEKLLDIIYRVNLFIYNINIFIELFYVYENKKYCLKQNDLQIIFDILKYGENYDNKEHEFYKFYKETFQEYYFNPNKKENNILLDGSYLDQPMKLNFGVIYSSIVNNIKYNFEKYIFRLIKTKFNFLFEDEKEYYRLIKKCSTYEMYNNSDCYNEVKEKIKDLEETKNKNFFIEKTKYLLPVMDKLMFNENKKFNKNDYFNEIKEKSKEFDKTKSKKFDIEKLKYLSSILEKSVLNKKQKYLIHRSKNNIFLDELENSKKFESTININKSLIKKLITGEKEIKCKDDIDPRFLNVYKEILNLFDNNLIHSNFYDKLEKNPFDFIESMININNFLCDNKAKTFNVFPKPKKLIPRHITLDSNSINVIFLGNKYNSDIANNKRNIWDSVFGFTEKMYSPNKNIHLKVLYKLMVLEYHYCMRQKNIKINKWL
jgi:hypothetical protein